MPVRLLVVGCDVVLRRFVQDLMLKVNKSHVQNSDLRVFFIPQGDSMMG